MTDEAPYTLEWYLDENDRNVVHDWIVKELTSYQRQTIGVAMYEILQHEGEKVVDGEFGDHLGGGLYEFRVRQGPDEILKRSKREGLAEKLRASVQEARRKKNPEKILLRVFFHPHGDKLVLLLGGYDKADDPSPRRQQEEIKIARRRLEEWKRSGRSVI